MSFRTLIVLIIMVLCAGPLFAQEASQRSEITETTITLPGSANFTPAFFFADQFNDTSPPFFLSKNQPHKKIDLEGPTLLFSADSGIPFYVLPGEDIHIIPSASSFRMVTSSGERNHELAFFTEFNKHFPSYFQTNASLSLSKKIRSVDFPAALQFENQKEKIGFDFLEQYQKKHLITLRFYVFAKQFFQYFRSANLFAILGSSSTQIKNPLSISDLKESGLTDIYACDSCLNNVIYRMSAYAYRQYLVKQAKVTNGNQIAHSYEVTDSAFSGKTKDFLQFILFKEQLSKGLNINDPIFKRYLSSQNTSNFPYVEYLRKEFLFRNSNEDKKELLSAASASESWQNLINKHQGKLIFIDFWASWCVPCRIQMPQSKELARKYGPDQIKVLFISGDQSYNDWLKAARSEKLIIDDSFLIVNFDHSELKKKLKLNSFPRYVLIDRQGSLIDDHAPGPGTPELEQLISKYLKNK